MPQLTKNFHSDEFRCHDGTAVPPEYMGNLQALANDLQALRDALGVPIIIVSGYRSLAWNNHVEGAKHSQHLTASGADISCKTKTPKQLAAAVEKCIKAKTMRQGGIGLYKGWLHVDGRGHKERW